jgi:hypothetical protein
MRVEIKYNPTTTRFDVMIDGVIVGYAENYTDGDVLLGLERQRSRRAYAVTRCDNELVGYGERYYFVPDGDDERLIQIFRRGRVRPAGICYSRQRMMVRKMYWRARDERGEE